MHYSVRFIFIDRLRGIKGIVGWLAGCTLHIKQELGEVQKAVSHFNVAFFCIYYNLKMEIDWKICALMFVSISDSVKILLYLIPLLRR